MIILQGIVAFVAIAIGTNWLWVALSRFRHPHLRDGVVLEGEIIDFVNAHKRRGTRSSVSPVVIYNAPDGTEQRFTSVVRLFDNPYAKGQKVAVCYVAGRLPPAELQAHVDASESVAQLVLFGVLFWGVGLAAIFHEDIFAFLDRMAGR